MITYEHNFPTKYPLFEIFLSIWKFKIATVLFSPSFASISYEYIRIELTWNGKLFYSFRLWDTFQRSEDRLKKIIYMKNGTNLTYDEIKEIRDVADKKLEEFKE